MHLYGEYVRVKSLEEIKESIKNILEYNEICDFGDEEFSEFEQEHTCGIIGQVMIHDRDDNSYLVKIVNDGEYWYHESWIEKIEPYINKFKVGDTVEILPKPNGYPFAWNKNMDSYVGKIGTIAEINGPLYRIEECELWMWAENCLTNAVIFTSF